ncbi:CYTOCHROME P450 FAMILY MEMBER [Salix koriyanagi]|uniref:CYTOCHROME P450 FAMILY MEMBER n=1 Tax=Salix koriyanagi TaxID=2511006 RepID=A0A9Q0UDS3_9ROSI|nr:CYTOCHROME P450 FAMILY MEMBER [Salix koriyanagi]
MKEFARSSKEARSRPIALNHQISPRVLPFFYKMVQIYGKVSLSWMGTRPRLLLADPELMRLVFTDTSGHIVKPNRKNPSDDPSIFSLLPRSGSTMEEISRSSGITCEMDVSREFHLLQVMLVARAAFEAAMKRERKIFDLQKDQVILSNEAFYSIYFPGLRFIPTKKNTAERYARSHSKLAYLDIDSSIHASEYRQEKAERSPVDLYKKTADIDSIKQLKIVPMILNEVLRLYPPVTILHRHTLKGNKHSRDLHSSWGRLCYHFCFTMIPSIVGRQ